MKPVIVIGAGGHAKVVLRALLDQGRNVVGLTDRRRELIGQRVLGVPVLGRDDDVLREHPPSEVAVALGIGAVARYSDNGLDVRRDMFNRLERMGYAFAPVVGRGAIVAEDARLGSGVQVMSGAVVQPGCVIGANTIINTGARVDHDCRLGRHNHVAPGAILCGSVMTNDECYVGAGAIIIQNVRIGSRTLIAAGVTVSRDVGPDVVFDRRRRANSRK